MENLSEPKWNKYNANRIVGEDHLGIRYVAIIIADYLQNGITSITPRARYWSFYTWVLHDFINNSQNRSLAEFKKYLKRQEWFYILANIAQLEGNGPVGLIGVTKGQEVWNTGLEELPERTDYLKNSLGGYGQAYRNVIKILGFTREADTEKGVEIDRITEEGKALAIAFENTIKHTDYYRNYRLSSDKIPRRVLKEYGDVAGLDRLNQPFSQDLYILKKHFMPDKTEDRLKILRCSSLEYYMYIIKNHGAECSKGLSGWRNIIYDKHSIKGQQYKKIPDIFDEVAKGWEIYHGRQLFTYGLEAIWSYVLDLLSIKPCLRSWLIENVIENLKNEGIDVNNRVEEILHLLPLDITDREEYIKKAANQYGSATERVYYPLLLMLDVYYRFKDRSDFNEMHKEFINLGEDYRISQKAWERTVEDNRKKQVKQLISHIIRYFILEQHQIVALDKLLTTNNETYHFIENEGILYFISSDRPRFNTFRTLQGVSILKDLGLI